MRTKPRQKSEAEKIIKGVYLFFSIVGILTLIIN